MTTTTNNTITIDSEIRSITIEQFKEFIDSKGIENVLSTEMTINTTMMLTRHFVVCAGYVAEENATYYLVADYGFFGPMGFNLPMDCVAFRLEGDLDENAFVGKLHPYIKSKYIDE